MTDRMDHLENGYRGPNQDHPTLVEDFRTPQEVKKHIEKAKFDGFDAGFDAGYDTGVQDAFTDARVCAGCGRIAFKTKLLMLIVIATLALFGPGRYQVIVVGNPYVDCEPIGKQVVYSVERR